MSPTNDTLERLAGGIAHDFDALLTAIIGHADSLSDCLSPGDPRSAQVHAIRRAAEQASTLTRQLLAFSRTQTVRPIVLDMNAMIAGAKHRLQRILGDGVSLEIQPCHAVWPVRADTEQLNHILHHLAVSAAAAMPHGGAVVVATANVRVAATEAGFPGLEPGDYVELSVADTGAQIQSAIQPHLFEPFFRATERPRGGLGLAMVYGAVKQSGGHIAVDSPLDADGRGSRFRIYLPAWLASAEDASAAPEAGTVLVLGDDPNVQAFVGDVLKRRGYRLLVAKDAWEALHLAQNEPAIDLLIAMSADGPLVADAIQVRRPEMRVLHVPASADDAPEDAGRDGERAILMQPFTPAALARKVRAVLS